MDVLSAFKADEVKKCVSAMTEGEKDIAMKYIYKGMAAPETYNSAVLLVWHGAVSPPPYTHKIGLPSLLSTPAALAHC